jgi:hypothetical protein
MYKDFSLEGATREEVKKEKRLQQLREKKERRDMQKEEMEQLKRDRLQHICAFFPVSCKPIDRCGAPSFSGPLRERGRVF